MSFRIRIAKPASRSVYGLKSGYSFKLLFLIAAAAAFSHSARAQSISGTVLGTVKDPSGNIVAMAKVQLVNKGTDAQRATLTNDAGDFRFPEIEAGLYLLTIEAPGFQRQEFAPFDLLARETRRLDSSLKVATQTQSVNVEASRGAVVQTDTSNISETKTGRELVDLPVAIATRASGSTSPI
ncbi:MAG: TonB-dependent receptor plug [Bryobacterales bacterium]|nr:TonB-dependent receptor plug [Bryobacterales bacterium]